MSHRLNWLYGLKAGASVYFRHTYNDKAPLPAKIRSISQKGVVVLLRRCDSRAMSVSLAQLYQDDDPVEPQAALTGACLYKVNQLVSLFGQIKESELVRIDWVPLKDGQAYVVTLPRQRGKQCFALETNLGVDASKPPIMCSEDNLFNYIRTGCAPNSLRGGIQEGLGDDVIVSAIRVGGPQHDGNSMKSPDQSRVEEGKLVGKKTLNSIPSIMGSRPEHMSHAQAQDGESANAMIAKGLREDQYGSSSSDEGSRVSKGRSQDEPERGETETDRKKARAQQYRAGANTQPIPSTRSGDGHPASASTAETTESRNDRRRGAGGGVREHKSASSTKEGEGIPILQIGSSVFFRGLPGDPASKGQIGGLLDHGVVVVVRDSDHREILASRAQLATTNAVLGAQKVAEGEFCWNQLVWLKRGGAKSLVRIDWLPQNQNDHFVVTMPTEDGTQSFASGDSLSWNPADQVRIWQASAGDSYRKGDAAQHDFHGGRGGSRPNRQSPRTLESYQERQLEEDERRGQDNQNGVVEPRKEKRQSEQEERNGDGGQWNSKRPRQPQEDERGNYGDMWSQNADGRVRNTTTAVGSSERKQNASERPNPGVKRRGSGSDRSFTPTGLSEDIGEDNFMGKETDEVNKKPDQIRGRQHETATPRSAESTRRGSGHGAAPPPQERRAGSARRRPEPGSPDSQFGQFDVDEEIMDYEWDDREQGTCEQSADHGGRGGEWTRCHKETGQGRKSSANRDAVGSGGGRSSEGGRMGQGRLGMRGEIQERESKNPLCGRCDQPFPIPVFCQGCTQMVMMRSTGSGGFRSAQEGARKGEEQHQGRTQRSCEVRGRGQEEEGLSDENREDEEFEERGNRGRSVMDKRGNRSPYGWEHGQRASEERHTSGNLDQGRMRRREDDRTMEVAGVRGGRRRPYMLRLGDRLWVVFGMRDPSLNGRIFAGTWTEMNTFGIHGMPGRGPGASFHGADTEDEARKYLKTNDFDPNVEIEDLRGLKAHPRPPRK